MKVAVLASRRIVDGFLLGGVHMGYVCENIESSQKALDSCLQMEDIGIILVSSTVASLIPEKIREIKISPRMTPVISVIPDIVPSKMVCEGVPE